MQRTFLVRHTPSFKGWETCFHSLMEKSDTFRIIFKGNRDTSDADAFLNAGKWEFLNLPSVTISAYEGMENSIEVTGELSMAARELFQTFMAPAFEGWKPELWSFQFLQGNEVLLRIEDFTVGLLFLQESDVEDLLAQGVEGLNVLEIDNFSAGAHQSGVEVVRLNKDELPSLADVLQTTFQASHENVPTPPDED